MPRSPRNQPKAAAEGLGAIRILERQEYEKIRKKPRTVEMHLASALFPQRKITVSNLSKFVANKLPPTGKHNVVFHFRSTRKDELTNYLEKALKKINTPHGEWFVVLHDAIKDEVQKTVPKGKVKSAMINKALAGLSKKNS